MSTVLSCCEEKWDEHYSVKEENVGLELWEVLKSTERFSEFVKIIEFYELDSIIDSSNPTTLFIPNNEAFEEYMAGDSTGLSVTIKYHLVNGLFQLQSIDGQYRLRTYSEKFALIEKLNNTYYFDETEIIKSSPLFKNGKYYEVAKVVEPKLSLYEYLKFNHPAFGNYIDTQDSTILNREESEPLGYDEFGRTIYDTVSYEINVFEEEYFRISDESRSLTATLVIPGKESYEEALDEMASNLNSSEISNFKDIPVEWQNEILIPRLLHKGIFGGSLDQDFFNQLKYTNVRGDSIVRDFEIDPDSRIVLSNGIIYNYNSFTVKDSLYLYNKVEGESLIKPLGVNRFSWDETLVEFSCTNCVQPIKQRVPTASNDSVIDVSFAPGYEGSYSISFQMDYVFPGTYRGVWRSNYITSGLFNVYVNGEKVVEEFDTRSLIEGIFSVDPNLYKLWPDELGYNEIDFWVDIEEYGSVEFTLEYIGPGSSTSNGLVMDYVGLFIKDN